MQFFRKNRDFKIPLCCILSSFLLFPTALFAGTFTINRTLNWKLYHDYSIGGKTFTNYLTFDGANNFLEKNYLPFFQEIFPIDDEILENVSIISTKSENINPDWVQSNNFLKDNFQLKYELGFQRGKPTVIVSFIPLALNQGMIQKLISFSIRIVSRPKLANSWVRNKKPYASSSVLSSGNWFKLATVTNGIYRIDYATLKNIGMDVDAIDPRKIQLFGHGAGMLPQGNSKNRIDDLAEISITVQGESDGKFNPGDYIAFYGESQLNQWKFDPASSKFSHFSNLYCDTTYYFLTIGNQTGKRIQKNSIQTNPDAVQNSYNFLYCYENEKSNLIKSGKVWVGEEFDRVTQQSFNVSIPFLISTEPILLNSSVTARSFVSSEFKVILNGTTILTHPCSTISPGYEQPFTCGLQFGSTTFTNASSNFTLDYYYNKPASGSIGWLDYFELQAKAELRNYNGNFVFRSSANIGSGKKTQFDIAANRNLTILDVSDPVSPFIIEGALTGSTYSFIANTDSLKLFAVYDGSNFFQVINAGKVANQNLHALPFANGFIITHPLFLTEAKRLAEHHRKFDSMTVHVVNIQDIYNEFSGGAPDLCATRDFLRMFYKRATVPAEIPAFVTLMGRASYDYKYRQNPNTNFIPTFESIESFDPTGSYCSDDFIALLDDNEGRWELGAGNELLDIGIGRLPVSNNEEANSLVNKIISYTSNNSLANWRNVLVFTADDGDGNTHQKQSDDLANIILNKYPEYNVEKIFLDAYKKESTAGGSRYPDAQTAFNNAVDKGCLVFNYTGHGGEVGLTAERVMGIDDINSWTNGLNSTGNVRLPLFVTATCEFSRFDDPARNAAGELVLLNPNGGGIGLFTTVRLVYSGENALLNERFYEHAGFDSISQLNPPRLGDIIRETKNATVSANTRNFTLLGDPMLTLAYPNYEVKTTFINGIASSIFSDTLKALKKFEMSGVITDKSGNIMKNFNGIIFPTVYDKFAIYTTLGNDAPSNLAVPFIMQNNVLYRGKSSVENGSFKFTFIVPKDIAYEYGKGKISYYSNNDIADANGYDNKILIGGTSDSASIDKKGPEIKLFLNDEKFVNGGLSNESPTFIAKLYDENGINTTGRGIGRDLTGILNNNYTQSIIMNDYYQATINSYQSGEVQYKYKNLRAGKHQIKFKAYDVYNNLSEAILDFEVKNSAKPEITHLLNYPNPFNDHTTFHFDHNQPGENISVMIQIFTVSGKMIKTLQTDIFADGNHFDQLNWDAKDEFGDRLAKGVYIYKLKLKSPGNKAVEKIEKLVILN